MTDFLTKKNNEIQDSDILLSCPKNLNDKDICDKLGTAQLMCITNTKNCYDPTWVPNDKLLAMTYQIAMYNIYRYGFIRIINFAVEGRDITVISKDPSKYDRSVISMMCKNILSITGLLGFNKSGNMLIKPCSIRYTPYDELLLKGVIDSINPHVRIVLKHTATDVELRLMATATPEYEKTYKGLIDIALSPIFNGNIYIRNDLGILDILNSIWDTRNTTIPEGDYSIYKMTIEYLHVSSLYAKRRMNNDAMRIIKEKYDTKTLKIDYPKLSIETTGLEP